MFIQSRYKTLFILLLIISFLGSCKPYKSVFEEEKQNELITNSIQADYEIENIYKINKKSTLELNLEGGKKYKFQYFSKRYFDMILLDSQSEIIATNKISYGDSSYRTKTIIFECQNTGRYNLKLEGKRFPNSSLFVVALQDLKNEINEKEEYVFIRNYKSPHERNTRLFKNGILRHTCVFSKGTTYKFKLEKGAATLKLYKARNEEKIIEFYPKINDKEFIFECEDTGIYYLEATSYVEDEIAVFGLYFKLSESRKAKLKIISLHQISKEGNKITKVFIEDTTYFLRTKGCGESIKVEITEDGTPYNLQEFEFKNGEERFIFRSRKTGVYHIKVTKINPEDNHETTLIIEQ
ncbi:hypothetical protein WAF17_17490 [Bernardetia sp. ABR2-2B]|uniref:hypothetical protein n=1 Tax=Bernardetia sp. ABR2-2B TaxID=3127472 RepID=UPI0030CBF671